MVINSFNIKRRGLFSPLKILVTTLVIAGAAMTIGLLAKQASASSLSIFPTNSTPAVLADSDTAAVELGMKFRSSVPTTVTGVKFYKGTQNTGTHTGSLWSRSGSRLATVTFTNETASGWQTANFSKPVAITANTTYVVSYFAPNGRYSVSEDYFATNRTSVTLTALKTGTDGGNGVYRYSSTSRFPNQTYKSSNYWVDVITEIPDTTPPTVSLDTPSEASKLSGVVGLRAEATDNVEVANVQFKLNGENLGTAKTATPYTYDWDTATVEDGEYTLSVTATDKAGNSATSSTVTVTVKNTPDTITSSLWDDSAAPAVTAHSGDTSAVELGVKFQSAVDGQVAGVKFYKGATNTGTHTGSLWSSSGTRLATATFVNETASGWQTVNFSQPVSITAGTTYVVSYYAPNGNYAADSDYFANNSRQGGVLTAPESSAVGGNGVYKYGSTSSFPNETWNATNYWVDVIVDSEPLADDTTAPTVSLSSPANGATLTGTTTVTANATDNRGIANVQFKLNGQNLGQTDTSAPYSVQWNTVNTSNGNYALTAVATDWAGNTTTSSEVAVTVNNANESTPITELPRIAWEGGSDYWKQFPQAHASGMSDPSFFPVSVFFGKPSHAAALKDIGVNIYQGAEHDGSTLRSITDKGMLVMPQGEWTASEIGNNDKVVGYHVSDECDMGYSGCDGNEQTALATQINYVNDFLSRNDGRFLQANFGNGVLKTYWSPNTMNQHVALMDAVAVDKYIYTSPDLKYIIDGDHDAPDWPNGAPVARSYGYGWLTDSMRSFMPANDLKPVWPFIESAKPYVSEPGSTTISTDQFQGAIWSSIIHEARGISIFQHNNGNICGNYSLVECDNAPGRLATIKSILAKVHSLAPVINTQSYQYDFANNTDTMLKVHNGSAYVFAGLGFGDEPGSKTFALPTGVTGSTVTVVGENRTIPVVNGRFTDSFAAEYSNHVYKIDL